ncbi:MAG: hypothetical protein Q4F15_03925 [Bacillota bacterium]|nr:hypothetical protein [Bacillota bacterium]
MNEDEFIKSISGKNELSAAEKSILALIGLKANNVAEKEQTLSKAKSRKISLWVYGPLAVVSLLWLSANIILAAYFPIMNQVWIYLLDILVIAIFGAAFSSSLFYIFYANQAVKDIDELNQKISESISDWLKENGD